MPIGLPAPVHVMRVALRHLPPPAIAALLRQVNASLRRLHAPLLRRLGHIGPAAILFAPSDVPHCFVLRIEEAGVTLGLAAAGAEADVTMAGSLATLLDLLESRIDSDTAFFSRELSVSGNTGIAVAFRNTLDGEAINLFDDALARLGPLAPPAERIALRLHRRVGRAVERWGARRDAAHRAAHGGHDPLLDRERTMAALDEFAGRIDRLEARGRAARGAA